MFHTVQAIAMSGISRSREAAHGLSLAVYRLALFHRKNADLSQNQAVIKISFKCLTEDIKRVYSDINITLRGR